MSASSEHTFTQALLWFVLAELADGWRALFFGVAGVLFVFGAWLLDRTDRR